MRSFLVPGEYITWHLHAERGAACGWMGLIQRGDKRPLGVTKGHVFIYRIGIAIEYKPIFHTMCTCFPIFCPGYTCLFRPYPKPRRQWLIITCYNGVWSSGHETTIKEHTLQEVKVEPHENETFFRVFGMSFDHWLPIVKGDFDDFKIVRVLSFLNRIYL